MGRLASYAPGATNLYIYDGDERIAEYDSAGTLTRRYVYGPGTDEPLVHYEGANLATRNFFHADERGSIIARTDMSGAMNANNRYDEYGTPASTNNGNHGYTGQMWLQELNLWYYKARIYSPHLGRFMQMDPVGYEDQVNLYTYVTADPINNIDPDGRYRCGRDMGVVRCGRFTIAQNRAINQLRATRNGLAGLRSRLISGRLTAGDRRLQAQLNRYLGAGAGSSQRVVGAAIDAANRMLGMLESDIPANMYPQVGNWYVSTPRAGPNGELRVYPQFFRSSGNQQAQSLAHDAHHGGLGSRDRSWGSIGPFGERNVLRRAREAGNPGWVLTGNADAATMAMGFTRDDD